MILFLTNAACLIIVFMQCCLPVVTLSICCQYICVSHWWVNDGRIVPQKIVQKKKWKNCAKIEGNIALKIDGKIVLNLTKTAVYPKFQVEKVAPPR